MLSVFRHRSVRHVGVVAFVIGFATPAMMPLATPPRTRLPGPVAVFPAHAMRIVSAPTRLRPADVAAGAWNPTGPMGSGRNGNTATLLPSGKVLVAGGGSTVAELYDPATNSWAATGATEADRYNASATLLLNGKVLVAGGSTLGCGSLCFSASAELYDPATGTWTPTGAMGTARGDQQGVLLQDGRVLVVGDDGSAELYDPADGTWSPTSSLLMRRSGFTVTLLRSGKVLVAGGTYDDPVAGFYRYTGEAELYDPASGTWTRAGAMSSERSDAAAVLLTDGRVMVAGGTTAVWGGVSTPPDCCNTGAVEIYDPATGAWAPAADMTSVRADFALALLPDGRVLASGGYDHYFAYSSAQTAEVYDPTTGTWTPTWPMTGSHTQHTATVLADGRILVSQAPAEVYTDGPTIAVNAAALDFGPGLVGVAGAPQPLVITNTGTSPLSVSAAITGANATDFIVEGPCGRIALLPGAHATLLLAFAPQAEGARAATLAIAAGARGAPTLVRLAGTGATTPTPTPTLTPTATPVVPTPTPTSTPVLAGPAGSTVPLYFNPLYYWVAYWPDGRELMSASYPGYPCDSQNSQPPNGYLSCYIPTDASPGVYRISVQEAMHAHDYSVTYTVLGRGTPTLTSTPTPLPTGTPTMTPTMTPASPTGTATATATPSAVPVCGSSQEAGTDTPTGTPTATAESGATATASGTAIAPASTATRTPTVAPTPAADGTGVGAATATGTDTVMSTPTTSATTTQAATMATSTATVTASRPPVTRPTPDGASVATPSATGTPAAGTRGQATGTAIPRRRPDGAMRRRVARKRPGALYLTVLGWPKGVTSRGIVTVRVATGRRARVTLILQVMDQLVTDARRRDGRSAAVPRVVYTAMRAGIADGHGRFTWRLPLAYNSRITTTALLTVSARRGHQIVTRGGQVIVYPRRPRPRAHRRR